MTDKELIQELRSKAEVEGAGSTRRLLELAARALERGQWVSVMNRIPDADAECLAFSATYKEMIIGHLYENKISASNYSAENDELVLCDVTHWMPLPEPPEEVTGDE